MYKLGNNSIIRLSDNASIPLAVWNRDYDEYLEWVKNGGVPQPEFTSSELLANAKTLLKSNAQIELDKTDLVALRCWKANVAYPTAWQTYTTALRAIVSGTDTTSTVLPTMPSYPAGT